MAKLQDFLVKGQLGDVMLGMRPEQVEHHWGPAPDRSVTRRPIEVFKYGSVELAFGQVPDTVDSRLISAAIYFFDPRRVLPPSVTFEDWSPTDQTTEPDFRQYLASVELDVHSKVDGENTHLVLGTGASVVFVGSRLHSIRHHRQDRGANRRQVSVSIPEAKLDQLRERARREKIPLKRLVERVLSSID